MKKYCKYVLSWGGAINLLFILLLMTGCRPEMPVTSFITIEADGLSIPVNKELYGLTIEEINHAVDGGLYAELIQNRSFEDGMPPLNCPYDAVQNVLITPNGWSIPFMRADSILGWHRISANTYIYPDTKELINDKNRRSLLVSVTASTEMGRGGVVAEGYRGISVRKGEKYNLSLFLKGASVLPKPIRIALEDSMATSTISDVYNLSSSFEWKKYHHTFTANEDMDNAVLTITADSSAVFWLDVVSLFPQETWNGYPNGQRKDLMEMIAGLAPRFIRFPGGRFVEGYTAGTYPIWKETVGDISERKCFWNIWAYGATNGTGYHEYLQICEDLKAEPVYVINSGVTSQSRRPRYEDITAMDRLVQDALDAIAYANAPTDSIMGAMRARHGHAAPFHLKFVEIGSENYGQEYINRFELFKKAINEKYPEVVVISSSAISRKSRSEWGDSHFYSGEEYFIANHNRFDSEKYSRRSSSVFIGEFGSVRESSRGSLRAAIGEACFLIGAENNPDIVKRLAYSPVLGNVNYEMYGSPLLMFDNHQVVASPSYYLWQLFVMNRGDEVLKAEVETYMKPQVTFGRVALDMFDNSYDIKEAKINNQLITTAKVLSGGWTVDGGTLVADANRWNYILMGDSSAHDYEFSTTIRRTKGSGQIQLHIRDNGKKAEQADYICMTLGTGVSELYHQAGGVKDSLTSPKPLTFVSNQWYNVRLSCQDDLIRCYVNDTLVHEANTLPLPSLVSGATVDKGTNTILLKVVNTTQHEEKTVLKVNGVGVKNDAEIIQLTGHRDGRNTFAFPKAIVPETKHISFSLGGPMIYNFPPNSITLIKLEMD